MNINRREVIAGIGAVSIVMPFGSLAFANIAQNLAEIAAKRFVSCGILPVHNEHDALFKPGAKLSASIPGHTLYQKHVDWFIPTGGKEIDPTPGIFALVDNIVATILPSEELKTFTMLIPKRGEQILAAANLSYGHLRLRVLRDKYLAWGENELPLNGSITRVDILYPKKIA